MDDMRSAGVDFITIGQYHQPTPRHHPVARYVRPRSSRSTHAWPGQGVPDGRGVALDPEFLPRRRRLRAAARVARLPSPLRPNSSPVPTHAEKRHLPYSQKELYELVARVERYPEFLPWCTATVRPQRDGNTFYADLVVQFKVFRERFRSKVTEHPNQLIDVEYITGPFRYLNNHWRFIEADWRPSSTSTSTSSSNRGCCKRLIGLLFNEAVSRMVGAFETRARQLYGERDHAPPTAASSPHPATSRA